MSAIELHPTTAALLLAARDTPPPSIGDRDDGHLIEAVAAWRAAGCPDAPAPRFVPTEDGWYWRTRKHENDPDDEEAVEVWSALGLLWRRATETTGREVEDDGLWLGPVAPWSGADALEGAPEPRTAEDARREPMAGDRWADSSGSFYTLLRPEGDRWWVRWDDGCESDHDRRYVPEPHETYLGNFPLETP